MGSARTLLPRPVWRRYQDKRLSSRLLVSTLHCRLGRVLDISAGGLRVRGLAWPRLRTYGPMRIKVHGLSRPVELEAEVAWVHRPGVFRREVGLAFTRLSDDALESLLPLFRAASQSAKRSGTC
ncbi:MAG: PilZ domain-containing protein [Phycisphaerales bacterium JB039]